MIPKFMLKKLYVANSLKQDGDKITFQILNNLYPGTITGADPVKIDELAFDLSKIKIVYNGETIAADQISKDNPFPLTKGVTFTFLIEGVIQPGKHKIEFNFHTKEAGSIAFDVEDEF
ncbi:MAG: hypothetical protein ACTSSB_02385 [Candidatus Heimdallarchaeota archaeon]